MQYVPLARRTFLGWARGIDRTGRDTGIWHIVQRADDGSARAACEARQKTTAGYVSTLPPVARLCQRIGCDNARRDHEAATTRT